MEEVNNEYGSSGYICGLEDNIKMDLQEMFVDWKIILRWIFRKCLWVGR